MELTAIGQKRKFMQPEQSGMKNIIVVKSPVFFMVGVLALAIYSYSYFTTIEFNSPYGIAKNILGGAVLGLTTISVVLLSRVIKFGDSTIDEYLFFGLVLRKKYHLSSLKSIDSNPSISSKLPKLLITFEDGSICIYEFQTGFREATLFFQKSYPDFIL
ncbi:hypothetical protein HZU75_11800 [Chitinibacter fontanus]|uniref:PH domain-containing protein n=1 Tax=Chitinibacter fontanus TaxID=1737446 RepID=A0A7D5VAR0_9NEIS|nr:hypothetical protein [Chitinibacter fontanus]QLI82154.1 hypothetical protein HZU75_11800 [Chitinibacter fontanus]